MITADVKSNFSRYSSWIKRMGTDSRMLATHVSLFTGLFVCWQRSGFQIPFTITRKTLMAYSRIASIATYHKCIKELDELGYIRYQPSYHPRLGSLVWLPKNG
ncbi:hypothetical protein [Mucilaginibacter sp. CSA2-8R]|uniref:hypothetical protein n=1 Tax=Mucilaginibacter sp. CSA2-8R TaxID=3141542 RepID=UPI00315D3FF4